MKDKITFLYGLGDRKEYKSLFKYFNIPKINWNKSRIQFPSATLLANNTS